MNGKNTLLTIGVPVSVIGTIFTWESASMALSMISAVLSIVMSLMTIAFLAIKLEKKLTFSRGNPSYIGFVLWHCYEHTRCAVMLTGKVFGELWRAATSPFRYKRPDYYDDRI